MERDYPEESNTYERLDTDLSERDPADVRDEQDDTDVNRRDTLTNIIGTVEPGAAPPSPTAMGVYGDTDMTPNQEDQTDAHRNDADDIV